ncbi:MAG TPA: nitrous oxide reductase accessory protein NosL [Gemmatimonadaceae bacterium]
MRALFLASLALLACAPAGPRPLRYGADACDFCRMQMTDPRFGGEVVSRTGKVRVFDSIECLAAYTLQSGGSDAPRSVWVADFRRPGTLVPVERASFLHAGAGPASPMGLGLVAVRDAGDAAALGSALDGEALRWPEVLALVEREQARLGLSGERTHAMGGGGDDAAR